MANEVNEVVSKYFKEFAFLDHLAERPGASFIKLTIDWVVVPHTN